MGILRLWWSTIIGFLHVGPREHWEMLRQDTSFAFRMMRRQPGFTALAALVLALGIGANTAIFSLVNGVLLQPLPYSNGNELIYLRQQAPKSGVDSLGFSPKELADYREQNESFSDLVEYHVMSFILLGRPEPERVQTGVVSANYFEVFGVKPLHGRTFRPDEERPGADPVLVLSYEYWMRSHGGDPNVVGKVFKMNDRAHTVVGVLPLLPQFPQQNDVYMPVPACPFRSSQRALTNRNFRLMSVFGRLKAGVPVPQAQADLATIAHRMEQTYPDSYPVTSGLAVKATPLKDELTQTARTTFLILLGTAGLVLLIACANVANLMLARVLLREREIAVRAAMGASRLRLLRQMITESVLLALAGGAIALLFAAVGLDLLVQYAERFTPRAAEIRLDGTVLGFTLLVSVVTGLVFGAIPALSIRRDLVHSLNQAGGRSTAGAGRIRARAILVVAQVAVSFMLIIGAGLMVRSLMNLTQVNPGFNSERVLTMQIALNFSKYRESKDTLAFGRAALSQLQALPGVISAAASVRIPLQTNFPFSSDLLIEGRPAPAGQPAPRVDNRIASEEYFQTIGQPLVRGRFFTESDREGAPLVAIINQRMARHFWENEDPIGRRISRNAGRTWFTIVGVVGDVRQYSLDSDPVDEMYLPFAQNPGISNLLLRTTAAPMGLARQVSDALYRIDPDQPVYGMKTLEEVRSESLAPKRLTTILLGLFAAVALVITAAGITGVMALSVSQRTQEIGVRMALGASPVQVLVMVVRQGMSLVLIGLALGIAGALGLTRVMQGLLFGVTPTDPVTFLSVSAVLALCAAAACFLPARRAATIDPIAALRSD